MKKRNAFIVFLLSIVTLGIYGVVWFQKFGNDCKRTNYLEVGNYYRLNILTFLLGLLIGSFTGALVPAKEEPNWVLIGALTLCYVLIRVADAVIIGRFSGAAMKQINKFFGLGDDDKTPLYLIVAIIIPELTFALIQHDFNKAEAVAEKQEAKKV